MTEPEYEISEFIRAGSSPFGEWFESLDPLAASKITTAIYRLRYGSFSSVRSVGGGVFEYKIDFGPGYRIYFGYDGKSFIILLSGGTKKRQRRDIWEARTLWLEYKARKRTGR